LQLRTDEKLLSRRLNYLEQPCVKAVPSDIYREDHASDSLEKARKARKTTDEVLRQLNIRV